MNDYEGNFGHLYFTYLHTIIYGYFGFVYERSITFSQGKRSEAEPNRNFEFFDHQFNCEVGLISYLEFTAYLDCDLSSEIEVEVEETPVNLTLMNSQILVKAEILKLEGGLSIFKLFGRNPE